MPQSAFSDERSAVQTKCREYAEHIWEAGGETRLAHDAEVHALVNLEDLIHNFRIRLALADIGRPTGSH